MYSEKTKFYTHTELGVQTVALKDGQVYFIPKDFTGRVGYKCNDALVRRLCKGQRMLMVPVGPDTKKMRKVLGVPCHEALAIINDIARYITEKEAYRLWFDEILLDFMKSRGHDIRRQHRDCGSMIFDAEAQDTHSGGSGCGCSALVLAAEILPKLMTGQWQRVLFLPTGALLSSVSFNEGNSVPGIAHGVILEHC